MGRAVPQPAQPGQGGHPLLGLVQSPGSGADLQGPKLVRKVPAEDAKSAHGHHKAQDWHVDALAWNQACSGCGKLSRQSATFSSLL